MTQAEAHKIAEMQKEGAGYRRIATVLGMPINTVKSYCQRHPVSPTPAVSNNCKHCGADLEESAGKRKKQFCCDQCRMAWWNKHRYMVQRKATRQEGILKGRPTLKRGPGEAPLAVFTPAQKCSARSESHQWRFRSCRRGTSW